MKILFCAAACSLMLAPNLSIAQIDQSPPPPVAPSQTSQHFPDPGADLSATSDDHRPVVTWMGAPDHPVFMARKAGSRMLMAFGAIGGLISASEQMDDGAHIRDQHHLVNPALGVAGGVASAFAKQHDARIAAAPIALEKAGLSAGDKSLEGATWLVGVTTLEWGITNRGLTGHYDVMYLARIEIRDIGNKRTLVKGACHHGGETAKGGASVDYATLMGEGPDGLRARFDRVTQECVDTFVREHLQNPQDAAAKKGQ